MLVGMDERSLFSLACICFKKVLLYQMPMLDVIHFFSHLFSSHRSFNLKSVENKNSTMIVQKIKFSVTKKELLIKGIMNGEFCCWYWLIKNWKLWSITMDEKIYFWIVRRIMKRSTYGRLFFKHYSFFFHHFCFEYFPCDFFLLFSIYLCFGLVFLLVKNNKQFFTLLYYFNVRDSYCSTGWNWQCVFYFITSFQVPNDPY